jgi:hypothetical protein
MKTENLERVSNILHELESLKKTHSHVKMAIKADWDVSVSDEYFRASSSYHRIGNAVSVFLKLLEIGIADTIKELETEFEKL